LPAQKLSFQPCALVAAPILYATCRASWLEKEKKREKIQEKNYGASPLATYKEKNLKTEKSREKWKIKKSKKIKKKYKKAEKGKTEKIYKEKILAILNKAKE